MLRQMIGQAGLLAITAILTAGCQAALPFNHTPGLDNTSFLNLWETYKECQLGQSVDAMRANAGQLEEGALRAYPPDDLSVPLPAVVENLISDQPAPRLAVDPAAMAAACAVRTGQQALVAGRNELAVTMFRSVIARHPHIQYAYYVEQARLGLTQANGEPPATLVRTEQPAVPLLVSTPPVR
jgi:hypothetical protein